MHGGIFCSDCWADNQVVEPPPPHPRRSKYLIQGYTVVVFTPLSVRAPKQHTNKTISQRKESELRAMDSCPVCYSTYSAEETETVARKLPCGHVACTQCLEDCFEYATERRDPGEPVSALTFGPSRMICYFVRTSSLMSRRQTLDCWITNAAMQCSRILFYPRAR